MNKFFNCIILCVIFTILIATPAFAQDNGNITMDLKPSTSNDVVFDKIQYTKEGDTERVRIEGSKKANGITKAYHIQVDTRKGTYTVEEKSAKEIYIPVSKGKAYQAKTKESNSVLVPKPIQKNTEPSEQSIKTKSTTNYHAWVSATTDDPVGEDLCETTLYLYWYDYGTTLGIDGNALVLWAANPSQFNTHWYNDDYDLPSPTLFDSDRQIKQEATADYYNWDFMDDDKKTEVSHWIEIIAQNDGTYEYTVEWERSGEYSYLLDLDVYTN